VSHLLCASSSCSVCTLHHHMWTVFGVWLLCVVELYHVICTVVAQDITLWTLEIHDNELTPMSVAVLDTTHILQAHDFLPIFTYAQVKHISVNFVYTTHYRCVSNHTMPTFFYIVIYRRWRNLQEEVKLSLKHLHTPWGRGGGRGIAPFTLKLGIRNNNIY